MGDEVGFSDRAQDIAGIVSVATVTSVLLIGIGPSGWTLAAVGVLALVTGVDAVRRRRHGAAASHPSWKVTVMPLVRVTRTQHETDDDAEDRSAA